MKILLVVTGFPSVSQPARSTFNFTYAHELALNHKVTILYIRAINPKRPLIKRTQHNNIDIVELSIILPFFGLFKQIPVFAALFRLVLPLLKFDVDVIQGVGGHTSIAAYLLSKKLRKPYFLHFIGGDINTDLPYFFNNQMFKDSIFHCSFLAFESKALENIFDTYFTNIKNKGVIYRGIKLAEYDYHFDSPYEINVLFLGGMPENSNLKGGFTLLESINELNKKTLATKLHFYIGGPEIPEMSAFIKGISNPNMEIHIIGAINKTEVKKYMAKSHLVIIPSLSEGLPNVMWEAMATGNMIIASKVGGIPEILNDTTLGVLINSNAPNELTEALFNITSEPKKIENYVKNARNKVESFNYQSFIDKNVTLFHNSST